VGLLLQRHGVRPHLGILHRPRPSTPDLCSSIPAGHLRSQPSSGPWQNSGRCHSCHWPHAGRAGTPRPKITTQWELDFRLTRQLSSYTWKDPPPTQVKPIPITVLHQATTVARLVNLPFHQALPDMITLGFYFLLRPGEYASSDNPDTMPFRFQDVHLMLYNRRLNPSWASQQESEAITFIGLEFTNQKNGVHSEIIGLGRSGNSAFCPVSAALRRVLHLRQHNAPPTQPLYSYFSRGRWCSISSQHLTSALRATVTSFGAAFGLQPHEISARSLRASGAMALLCANVDTDHTRLIGRWKSDEMLRYLHVQAFPVVADLAPAMLRHGHYSLIPNQPLGAPAPRALAPAPRP
jgi:hypothetical protein